MSEVVWRELPTLIRRSYDVWVTAFQDQNPGCSLQRVGLPRREQDGSIIVPFDDAISGAHYEVTVGADGAVGDARQLS